VILVADGHDVAVSATYGQPAGNGVGQYVTPCGGVVKVYPSHLAVSGEDVIYAHARTHFGADEGWIICLIDIWSMKGEDAGEFNMVAWAPVDHDPQLPWWALVLVLALNVLGLCIFRGANSEKDAFRRNPNAPEVAHLQFLPTKRGTRLLTSGWWGMARKINYTGDWLMGLSWCLTCGGASPVAYFYAIYFAVLLIHRAVRDDHFCSVKYGADWETYKQKVPAVFVPGII
jgi:protein-S-isoprenylcysteine O-methyltransferase Ste14